MRIASLTATTLLACGLTFAARSEKAVYTGGTVEGIDPQANVVVDLSSDKVLKVRAGRTDLSVPYAGVTKADLAASEASAPSAKSKLSLHHSAKPAQALTVEFKNAQGEAKTITLQLSQPAASNVMGAVRRHSPAVASAKSAKPVKEAKASKKDKAKDDPSADKKAEPDAKELAKNAHATQATTNADGSWWGDSVWKTNRNQGKWTQQGSAAAQ